MQTKNLYEKDFYAWTQGQGALLRNGDYDTADIANIAEEIETMGRTEKRELVNRLAVLMAHLLEWEHQPERRGRSWKLMIQEQRWRAVEVVEDNPSLKHKMSEIMSAAYQLALLRLKKATGIDSFLETYPFSSDEILKEEDK